MSNIKTWLKEFCQKWTSQDVAEVLALFAKDVEYWETPFIRLKGLNRISKEWQIIIQQNDIEIGTRLFSTYQNNNTVHWDLKYKDSSNLAHHYKGIYLIKLNSHNKCTYFLQCGEKMDNE